MYDTITFEEIAIAPSARARLTGVCVLGSRLTLRQKPGPAPDLRDDWARLHSAWRHKSRKEVEHHPRVQLYRSFYEQMGLDPNRTPPSVQGLVQRFLRGETLDRIPTIHPLVDAVNVAAVETMLPLGVFDASRVAGEIVIDLSRGGEPFLPIGGQETLTLAQGLVVLRDDEKVLSQFCHRDADAQKITAGTRSVWLLGCQVPGIKAGDVEEALARAVEILSRGYEVRPDWRERRL